ncbi:hypothetical protein N9M86_02080 [Euryarchaeota archaeon]|nr:hypothetical protein [Euryarchaeota archaeon]MDA8689857.1 hypothetical protein [Euryarchaeota archaeon]MDA9156356.1 hypothetical protein [Candidatus Poseidoniaceae archaeon]
MEGGSNEEKFSEGQRLGAILMGIFLMSFGMPFTLVPTFIVPEAISSGSVLFGAFMVCFTIPFLLAGLAVQYAGFTAVRFAIFPKSEKAREAFENGTIFSSTKTSTRGESVNFYASKTPAEKRTEVNNKLKELTQQEPEEQSSNFWDNIDTDSS